MVPFKGLGKVSYLHSIVTMVVSCIVSETLVENHDFFIHPLHLAPQLGGP